jgi:Ni/Fe-hydrogenase subunit HybB-like protein
MSRFTEELTVIDSALRSLRGASVKFWVAIALLSIIVGFGVFAWVVQLQQGMGVAGYSDSSFWAIYIANVVTFIGFSYGGAVVSAILLLTGASWRTPLARMSEGMALVTVLIGAAFVFPHLGRPDRVLGMITHANPASPVFWDFVAIITYTIATLVFFVLPLIPDAAILLGTHPDDLGRSRRWLYKRVSQGWMGSASQRGVLHRAMVAMAILIIPLAVSVHSVLAWAFTLVSRPGWHESIWAPYFVIAALYSGVALAILVIAGFRKGYHLEALINAKHFVRLGYIMATLGALYIYLTFADLLPGAYVGEQGPVEIVHEMMLGHAAAWFWLFLGAGTIVPILLVSLPRTRTISGMVVASVLVVIAMWIKRLIMVVETAGYDRLTMSFDNYFHFTWVSIAVTLAGAAAIPLLLMLLFRVVPLLAVDEIQELSDDDGLTAQSDAAREPAPHGHKPAVVAGGLLLIGLFAVGIGRAQPASAEGAVTDPAQIAVTAASAGPEVDVTATVTSADQAVADASVYFYASTPMFAGDDNKILLGKVLTGKDGVAQVSYVASEIGRVTVTAKYYFDPQGAPVTSEAQFEVTEARSPYVPAEARPLDGTGEVLVRFLFALVAGVFAIITVQVVRVSRGMRTVG